MNTSTDLDFSEFIFDHENHTIYLTPWAKNALGTYVSPPYFVNNKGVAELDTVTVNALSFSDIGLYTLWIKINDGGIG